MIQPLRKWHSRIVLFLGALLPLLFLAGLCARHRLPPEEHSSGRESFPTPRATTDSVSLAANTAASQ